MVLRLKYPQNVIDRKQSMDYLLKKSLILSGISKGNKKQLVKDVSNEELLKQGTAFHWDDYFKDVLCFKATPALVQAIMTDRNSEEHKFGCNPGCLFAGSYVQLVFYEKAPLKADTLVDFGTNLFPPKPKKDRQGRPAERK